MLPPAETGDNSCNPRVKTLSYAIGSTITIMGSYRVVHW